MKTLTKKAIPIFLALLTLFSIIPSCAIAGEQNASHSPGSEESFDMMKSRMNESINSRIEILENSKEELDSESLEAAEKLIIDLESIKGEVSGTESVDRLFEVKQRLDALLNTAPEELQNLPGFLAQDISPGLEMQNRTENFSRSFENRSERPPEMLNNAGENSGANAAIKSREPPGQPPEDPEEGNNLTEEDNRDESDESGLFGRLMYALKSLFS